MSQSEGAYLEFTVEHIGPCTGSVEVNESISYSDKEKNTVNFPSPEIEVDCGISVNPEGCPEPVNITVEGCEDAIIFDAGEVEFNSLGRIISVSATLKNVCPHKRVALAAILTEVDDHGIEHDRGMKTVAVPAHSHSSCRNVEIRCIKFVVTEDTDVDNTPKSICNKRNFKVRFIAHYIDSDFMCCDAVF